jgi:hypothetical protein
MSTAFEAEIRNSLGLLNSQVSVLTNGMEKLQKKGSDTGERLKKAFSEAEKKQLEFEKSIQKTGQSLSKIGGPLGALASRLAGTVGLGGAYTAVGVAATAAGFAIKVANDLMEEQVQRVKRVIDVKKQLIEVNENARKAEQQQGLDAVSSQGNNLRLLEFRGGTGAVDRANDIAKTGVTSLDDAQKGVARAFGFRNRDGSINSTVRDNAIDAAKMVAGTGEAGFAETVNNILSDPRLVSLLQRSGGVEDVAQRSIVKARGLPETINNRASAMTDLSMIRLNKFTDRINATQRTQAQTAIIGQDRLVNGDAESASRQQMAETKDPKSALELQFYSRQMQIIEELSKQAKARDEKWFGLVGLLNRMTNHYYNPEEWEKREKMITLGTTLFGEK